MKNLNLIPLLFLLISCGNPDSVAVKSPAGKIMVNFWVDDSAKCCYSVSYNDEVLIYPSSLGFLTTGGMEYGSTAEIVTVNEDKVRQSWKPVYGERSEIPNDYNQITIRLKDAGQPAHEFEICFRVYNEGVAFNYTFLPQEEKESQTIQRELTEFNFDNDYPLWAADRAQAAYSKIPISSISEPTERPLVVEAGQHFIAIGEAKLIDFSRMKLQKGNKTTSLAAVLHDNPTIELPYTTPWRTIMIGESPGELLENNYFLQNLNDPCALENVTWIKPGKVIREVTLTTRGGIACVDFAVENGLQYVEFDAGWYGNEYDDASDATTVSVDPKRSPGPLDLHKVIEYAESKGIGIILYVNRRALERQIDEILPLYKSWGIKGVKYGFVQVGSQEWTTWLHEAVKKAAENKLMVDIHDEYRPTGFSRTFPNLMTQEGIRGDEESPSNEHTLITLFTRMLAGAGDNTICYYAPRVTEKMGGHASQLAKAIMLYSPWQFLYWYDRPPNSSDLTGGVPGSKDYIMNQPEQQLFRVMPTVWDETRVLEGNIGEYATIARRTGDDWFLGSLTGKGQHQLNLNLSFLNTGSAYKAAIYTHDPESTSPTRVKINEQEVTSDSTLSFSIGNNSGMAIHFSKK